MDLLARMGVGAYASQLATQQSIDEALHTTVYHPTCSTSQLPTRMAYQHERTTHTNELPTPIAYEEADVDKPLSSAGRVGDGLDGAGDLSLVMLVVYTHNLYYRRLRLVRDMGTEPSVRRTIYNRHCNITDCQLLCI